jgi:predicted transcriptional regulator
MDSNNKDNYVMIPNNTVQNLSFDKTNKPSLIQLYGKRTVVYLKQLIELQNIREDIHFSTDMILWMSNIGLNIKRERKYFKDFLLALNKNNLIKFPSIIDLNKLQSNDFLVAKLNIYEHKEDKDNNKYKINYFMLLDSEYDTIINKYSGDLDKYNLLNLFCNIKSRIKRNPDNVSPAEREPEVAYPSYDTIMSDIFIESDKTLKKYIDALVELDLIRFDCAGDMIFKIADSQPIRRKSNFTYTLFRPQWEIELESAISLFKSRKKKSGWDFLTKDKEISANEKRSITQRINMLEKISTLTQTQKKELAKLKRQQEKWKKEYDNKVNIRKLEEDKLKADNPNKELSEIYAGMGFDRKAERADKDEANYIDWDEEESEYEEDW